MNLALQMAARFLGLVLVLAVAAALAGCGSRTDPARLAIGDCFDVPTGSDEFGSITKRACTEAHRGEVFHIFETSGAAGDYPTDPDWELIIHPVCDEAFEAYTGTQIGSRLDIDYLYLVPTADRWAAGDRRVTCFITSPEGTPLTKSERAP